jgi:hypothetical protein
MVKNPLVVTKFTLSGGEGRGAMGTTPSDYVLRDVDVRSTDVIAMPDDGIECKLLRGKTFVLEWGICNIMGGMHTTRFKVELPVSACENPTFVGGSLGIRMTAAPRVYAGDQPFDHSKRQRGKTTWMEYTGGSICDGMIFELFAACMQSDSIKVNLKNGDAKVRKELEALLDPTAAAAKAPAAAKAKAASGTPVTGIKRPAADMDLAKMSVAQINKMLRQMQEGPGSGAGSSSKAPAREYGSGGAHCDGCRESAEDAEDGLEVCERCQYAACGDCQVHHSRGTCFCKDANFGHAYPKKREWYMSGRW